MQRLLIANRGEIVCRIARTARRLGITSIAVYSDADRLARHTQECDEAYRLGPAPAAESYLSIPKIIALAKQVRADAVHPGYGFLSENADFAQAVADAGLTFVGPPAKAIRAMGSKSASKAAMKAVGVPVAPGYHGAEQDLDRLTEEAERVGYPLIIKASAGGGGKGMQVVRGKAEVKAAVESAKRLARTSFGDDHLLMERYFEQARHVEVQVFADGHGKTVSLFDRDCSVQRRHQKILEEAPAPGLRSEVRAAMSLAAIRAAEAVGYVSAGTVEFLVDEQQNFYFMEMNTRLQVEHPVTEEISGLDLVEWQLRVARGEPLPQSSEDLKQRGFAIEARLYAEDPSQGYLPSVGRIGHLRWPELRSGLRLDVGVAQGDEVSSYYDPMLGKLIAWGQSRSEALECLRRALLELEITGVTTNRALLTSILGEKDFKEGGVSTNYLKVHENDLAFGEPKCTNLDLALAALYLATGGEGELWNDKRGWRSGLASTSRWTFKSESSSGTVDLTAESGGVYRAKIKGEELVLTFQSRGPGRVAAECEGQRREVRVVTEAALLHLFREGAYVRLHLKETDDSLQHADSADAGSLLTPLPGTVVAVHVKSGQAVVKGAPLMTVEAMKMEHTLTAPYEGSVSRLAYAVGDRVPAGAVLVELAPKGA